MPAIIRGSLVILFLYMHAPHRMHVHEHVHVHVPVIDMYMHASLMVQSVLI